MAESYEICRRCKCRVYTDSDLFHDYAERDDKLGHVVDGRCEACDAAHNAPVPPLDVEALFSPTGPLSRPGFEARPGQVKLARSIFDALANGQHLLAEGPCFTPDALVLADGAYRPIGECTVGMSIETLRGGSHIEAVKRRHYSGPAVTLTTSAGFFPVTVTDSHKFYVLRRERCVIPSRSNTLCGNACETACPINVVKPHADRRMSGLPTAKPHTQYKIEVVEAKDLSEDDCLLVRQPREQRGNVVRENAYVELLGLWLAEGHVDGKNQETTRTCLTFSSTERETLAARALELGVELGFTGGIYDRPNNSVRVMIYGRKLAEQIVEDCGELSHAKRLPTWFACLSKQQQILLLTSLFKGDARVNLRPRVAGGTIAEHIRYVTVSLALATGVRDALHGLGVRCQAIREAARTDRNGVSHREAYRIQIPRRFMSLFGFRVETVRRDLKQIEHEENGEVYTLVPISKLTKTTYEGDVCNLTSAGHDSYLTDVGTSKNCGIGKSKAYGVPASYLASHGKKVLIVTASIALQEQLVLKDLPDLAAELPWDFSFALLKGRPNYLCRTKLKDVEKDGLNASERNEMASILEWAGLSTADATPTHVRRRLPILEPTIGGDKSELPFKPTDNTWRRVSTTSDECPGSKCSQYRECYVTQARVAAQDAGIVVTNYHMFFLNLASGGMVLPGYDVVILDEAHEAADIAREVLGFSVGRNAFDRVAKAAEKANRPDLADPIRLASRQFFDTLARFGQSDHYKAYLRWPAPIDATALSEAVTAYVKTATKSPVAEYAQTSLKRVTDALTLADKNVVYSIDLQEHEGPTGRTVRARLKSQYVEPGQVLSTLLWADTPGIAAVSATLTTDMRFHFARRELGAPDTATEIIVESPFNFARQGLLVMPQNLPEPGDPTFSRAVCEHMAGTVDACNGRTMGLFTSYRVLRIVAEHLRRHFPGVRTLCQGDMPTRALVEEFKRGAAGGIVLLGTTSFWTGVDVQGQALTGLVIDKLPFTSPDDPVSQRITEKDPRRAFSDFSVPKAILTLRQGVGRLIRSQVDIGAVVLLDKRMTSKAYGSRFLRSLPGMARATSTAAIKPFLASRGAA